MTFNEFDFENSRINKYKFLVLEFINLEDRHPSLVELGA